MIVGKALVINALVKIVIEVNERPKAANQNIITEKWSVLMRLANTPTIPSFAAVIHINMKPSIRPISLTSDYSTTPEGSAEAISSTPQKHATIPINSIFRNSSLFMKNPKSVVQNAYVFYTI